MQKTIVSDTSCLILLDNIGELYLLEKLFGEVYITSIIAKEFGKPFPHWVNVKDPINITYQTILKTNIDAGEASAIALAMEEKNSLIILDDLKARKVAIGLGLSITGTLGVLIEAKQAGFLKAIKPVLLKIHETNFHISSEIEKKILNASNE